MSNPYTERACALMKWREGEAPFKGNPLPPTPMASAEAQVNATLALAYEQRTQVLIGFLNHAGGEERSQIEAEIRERLELG